jgi:hypothetical protein
MLQAVCGDLDPDADADAAGRELMARGLAETLDAAASTPPKPPSPFEMLGRR